MSDRSPRQSGQALIESIVALPALLFFLILLAACLSTFTLRVQLLLVTQELATCTHSILPLQRCHSQARLQAEKMLRLWGFENVQTTSTLHRPEARLLVHGNWGPFRIQWSFREKPQIPFQ